MRKQAILLLFLLLFSSSVSPGISGGAHSRIVVTPTMSFAGTNLALGQSILEVQPGGSLSGSFIFTGGTLIKDRTIHRLTGVFDATNNKVFLNGGSIDTDKGFVNAEINASGSGNSLSGLARMTQPVVLADSTTMLSLGLESALGQDIMLNGGNASFIHDLTFGNDAFFTGPGTVTGGMHRIATGDSVLSVATALDFSNEVSLTLHNSLQLQTGALWVAKNHLNIDGNAQVIDITNGELRIDAGATLSLHDAMLNGVTAATLTFVDDASALVLNNMFVDVDSTVTLDQGAIKVAGETTLILRSKQLLLSGTASLTVDGAVLWYDSLNHDFYSDNKDYITILNGGMVRDVHEHAAADRLEIEGDSTVTTNFVVDAYSPVVIGGEGSVTLDASGHSIAFSLVAATQLSVLDGVNAVLSNVVLKDYSPANATIGDDGATLTYGDGTRMELGKDEVLSTALPFSGTATIDGKNYCLDLSTGGITVAASSTLTLKNMTLRNVDGTNLSGLANSSKIVFENVVFELKDDYDFSGGSFEVDKQLLVTGGYTFSYTTSQQSTIRANSSLVLDSGSSFHYDPSGGAKDRLIFAATTSRLVLSDSILKVASTGALLTTGTILIDDTGTFNSLASDLSGAIALGNGSSSAANCTVRITPHSTLHITNGVVKVNDA